MRKTAQSYSSLAYTPQLAGKTLADLYIAIRADAGLPTMQKAQLVQQIEGMTGGASAGTPLSALLLRGLGGTIGVLIAKYFGMGATGQLISAAIGYGLGSKLNQQLNAPPNKFPGWRMV